MKINVYRRKRFINGSKEEVVETFTGGAVAWKGAFFRAKKLNEMQEWPTYFYWIGDADAQTTKKDLSK